VAKTPFFNQPGADAVKRVVAGAATHKEDEKAVYPSGPQQPGGAGVQGAPNSGQPTSGQPVSAAPPKPPAEPVFAWRLVGISYGARKGMALFEGDGRNQTVHDGTALDGETKIVSISRREVVLVFHGKRLELTPW